MKKTLSLLLITCTIFVYLPSGLGAQCLARKVGDLNLKNVRLFSKSDIKTLFPSVSYGVPAFVLDRGEQYRSMLLWEPNNRNNPANDVKFYIFDGDNAYAIPDDHVYIGSDNITSTLKSHGSLRAMREGEFTVAHELGHHFQFRERTRRNLPNKIEGVITELQADVIAGYLVGYMNHVELTGLRTGEMSAEHRPWTNAEVAQWEETARKNARQAAYDAGDFGTTAPDHHGKPDTRANAFSAGYALGFGGEFERFRTVDGQKLNEPAEVFHERLYDWTYLTATLNWQREKSNY